MVSLFFPGFPNGLLFSRDSATILFEGTREELLVELLKRGSFREGHHKLSSRVPDAVLDASLLVCAIDPRCAEMRLEEVMTPKTHKHAHFLAQTPSLPRFAGQDLDRSPQIVVTDAAGNAPKVLKGTDVGIQKTFLRLRGKCHCKRPARIAETHEEELDLLALATQDHDRLAPINLG